jgi:lysyl-tRNA synthetase class 2
VKHSVRDCVVPSWPLCTDSHPVISAHCVSQYESLAPSEGAKETVSIAGRISVSRSSGKALIFYDVIGEGSKLQVYAQKDAHKGDDFADTHALLKRGDVIGVVGHAQRTARGELSIVPESIQLLAPCLRQLPSAKGGELGQEVR